MITVSLRDKNVAENLDAINYLRKTGLYTEEQLQDLYDKQVKEDEATQ